MATKKMIPGDDKHLTLVMAPFNLNFFTGKDRDDVLAYGRAVWAAALEAQRQSAKRQTLHVVAAGIRDGARVFGAYTDPATAESVKQVAWDDGRTDGASVTAVVVNDIDPALQATIDALKIRESK